MLFCLDGGKQTGLVAPGLAVTEEGGLIRRLRDPFVFLELN